MLNSLFKHQWSRAYDTIKGIVAQNVSGPPVSKMTDTVSSGTLNPSIPYLVKSISPVRSHFVEIALHSKQRSNIGSVQQVMWGSFKFEGKTHDLTNCMS